MSSFGSSSKPFYPGSSHGGHSNAMFDDEDGEIDVEGCDEDFDEDDDDDFDCVVNGSFGDSSSGALGGASGGERIRRLSGESGSSGGADQSEDSKRDHHNQLERKRRASIKNSFNSLREVIPDIRGSKASRAVILQKAVEYIDDLKSRNKAHSRCVDTLRRQNDNLEREANQMEDQMRIAESDAAQLNGNNGIGGNQGGGSLGSLSSGNGGNGNGSNAPSPLPMAGGGASSGSSSNYNRTGLGGAGSGIMGDESSSNNLFGEIGSSVTPRSASEDSSPSELDSIRGSDVVSSKRMRLQ